MSVVKPSISEQTRHAWREGLIVLLLALVAREVWAWRLPLDGGNDEIFHLYTSELYRALGRLAVVGQDPGTGSYFHPVYGFAELPYYFTPPGAHVLGALLLAIRPEGLAAEFWARQAAVAGGAVAVMLGWLTLRTLWPAPSRLPLAVSLLMALGPQFVFNSALFCDEWFAMAAVGVVFLAAARLLRDGLTFAPLALASLGLVLLALSRIPYWPAGIVIPLALLLRLRGAGWRAWCGVALCALLPLAAARSWSGRNEQLYGSWSGGTPGAVAVRNPEGRLPGFTVERRPGQLRAKHPYLYRYGTGYLALSTFMSFWGVYGYMGLLMPAAYYWFWGLFTVAGFAGLLAGLDRLNRAGPAKTPQLELLFLYGIAAVLLLLGHAYVNLMDANASYQPQGRYLFGALLPILTLLAVGVRELLRYSGRERWLVPLCVAAAAGANLWSLTTIEGAVWPLVRWIG